MTRTKINYVKTVKARNNNQLVMANRPGAGIRMSEPWNFQPKLAKWQYWHEALLRENNKK